jgi:molybdopterin synthase catalytic subunit
MIRVQSEPFDPAEELAALTASAGDPGAVTCFIGLVRAGQDRDRIDMLELQHFAGFTERGIADIAAAARKRFEVEALTIIHRHGCLAPGEAIVFVGAAARHRRAAFEIVDYVMDRLKTEAALWKKETGPSGSRWIEATDADRRDRERWDDGGDRCTAST